MTDEPVRWVHVVEPIVYLPAQGLPAARMLEFTPRVYERVILVECLGLLRYQELVALRMIVELGR